MMYGLSTGLEYDAFHARTCEMPPNPLSRLPELEEHDVSTNLGQLWQIIKNTPLLADIFHCGDLTLYSSFNVTDDWTWYTD